MSDESRQKLEEKLKWERKNPGKSHSAGCDHAEAVAADARVRAEAARRRYTHAYDYERDAP